MDPLQDGRNIFVTGSAGTGKTYHAMHLRRQAEKLYGFKAVGVAAPTGIAAIQLGGFTLHKLLGLQLFEGTIDSLLSRMKGRKKLAERWTGMKVLIIDEISMMDVGLFVRASEVIRRLRIEKLGLEVDGPWGGIQLILVGDFLQLPPVKIYTEIDTDIPFEPSDKNRTKAYKYLFQHPIWQRLDLHTVHLRECRRFGNDEAFFGTLGDVRLGLLSNRVQCLMKDCSHKPSAITVATIPDVEDDSIPVSIKPTVLIATNVEVDDYNIQELAKLPGKEMSYKSTYWCSTPGKGSDKATILKNLRIPEILGLKVGSQVMLLVNNLIPDRCNGSRGVVVGFGKKGPMISFVDGGHSSDPVEVVYYDYEEFYITDRKEVVKTRVSYIPLKLAWAITVHKSQGLSLDFVHLSLGSCFAPGMLYVALSRCRTKTGTTIKDWSPEAFKKCSPESSVLDFYDHLE